MADLVDVMLAPFVACLILTGIHTYLGLHVIERGIIFVDLALAQVAALGSTVGILFGWGLHSLEGYFCALLFTMFGAAVLAFTRLRAQVVPQEALIGIVYVMAAAASILVLSRAPEGGEELKNLMVGHVLFIEWSEVLKIAAVYSLVAAIHWRFRQRFWSLSTSAHSQQRVDVSTRFWDFLFYGTFGLVVTSSTEIAGVLLVFSFLIVPAVCAVLLARDFRNRLYIGWGLGAVTSLFGLLLSYYMDFPTGAAVVCTFGATLLLSAGAHYVARAS